MQKENLQQSNLLPNLNNLYECPLLFVSEYLKKSVKISFIVAFDYSRASRAVFVIVTGSEGRGRTETILRPAQ